MTKKVLAIAYNYIPLFGSSGKLWIGSIAQFNSREDLADKPGFIEITNDELLAKKYKKLAQVLISQKLIKKDTVSFRLDEVLGFAKKTAKVKKKGKK